MYIIKDNKILVILAMAHIRQITCQMNMVQNNWASKFPTYQKYNFGAHKLKSNVRWCCFQNQITHHQQLRNAGYFGAMQYGMYYKWWHTLDKKKLPNESGWNQNMVYWSKKVSKVSDSKNSQAINYIPKPCCKWSIDTHSLE